MKFYHRMTDQAGNDVTAAIRCYYEAQWYQPLYWRLRWWQLRGRVVTTILSVCDA